MSNIKQFFSRKFIKILSYDEILKATKSVDSNGVNKLIIHTPNGLYQGTLKENINYSNYEISENDDIITSVRKIYSSFVDVELEVTDKIEELSENPITVDLENVTLFTGNKTINLPFVSIFVDQIIGISIGSLTQEGSK